jgi:hypothetical protein
LEYNRELFPVRESLFSARSVFVKKLFWVQLLLLSFLLAACGAGETSQPTASGPKPTSAVGGVIGTVVDMGGNPAAVNVYVVSVSPTPTPNPDPAAALPKTLLGVDNGKFQIRNLPPGQYKIFFGENIDMIRTEVGLDVTITAGVILDVGEIVIPPFAR